LSRLSGLAFSKDALSDSAIYFTLHPLLFIIPLSRFLPRSGSVAKNQFSELYSIEGHFFFKELLMKFFNAAKSIISPFMEGIARNFDFAGSIGNFPRPHLKDADALISDWQMVGSDYNFSLKMINEELNASKKKSEK
jgi:hypothetical protein